jgi:hypothetical protein
VFATSSGSITCYYRPKLASIFKFDVCVWLVLVLSQQISVCCAGVCVCVCVCVCVLGMKESERESLIRPTLRFPGIIIH